MASAAHTHQTKARTHGVSVAGVADAAAYWLIVAATYVTVGFLFYYSAKEKLFDDNGVMPKPVAAGFHGSFIASFPGLNAAWVLLGLLEAAVFLVVLASLLAGEFLPTRRKPILLSGLALSMFAFGVMSFAENMTGQFATVSELFGYLAGTAVLVVLLLLMPPYRVTRWLSSLVEGRG
jgi:hypothetical protein